MIDLPQYHQLLKQGLQDLQDFVAPLTPAQLAYKKGEDWSILEIAEHIVLTEQLVLSLLSKVTTDVVEQSELFGSEKLKKFLVEYRHKKVKAPNSIVPTGTIVDAAQFMERLGAMREKLMDDLQTGQIAVTNATYKHPMLGEMTISDWLYFILHHSQRHLHQMQDRLAEMTQD